jgi:predicted amidohydrolase YtcJ
VRHGNAMALFLIAASVAMGTVSEASRAAACDDAADKIYVNGAILTIDDRSPRVDALAVKDGLILAVGARPRVMKHRGQQTRVVDLGGRAMVPGFVDAHSHFAGVGMQSISANLLPSPDGPVNSISSLQGALRDHLASSPIVAKYKVVIGFNYDDSQLEEKRHPTRHELDAVSTELPVIAMHQSGHLAVYNSKALESLGVDAGSPDPAGGVIEREADGKTPSGVMQENAHFMLVYRLMPKFDAADYMALFQSGERSYVSNGFTTAQEGKTDLSSLKVLPEMARQGAFKIDLVCYADLKALGDHPLLSGPLMSSRYTNGIRIGGVKLTFDGSPQGKTAWFTKPYVVPPAGQPKSYRGYAAFEDAEALALFELAYSKGWQVLTHTNGDAAIDQLIRVVRRARAAKPQPGRRDVMIHGQFLRKDQVAALKSLRIFPALYPMHTFYWGDWHRDSVAGPERAENISPTGWLRDEQMPFTIHSDAPVTFPNSMRILDSAVNRTTRSGKVLGAAHRLEPITALKAMTLWAAYQHGEEALKGSLEVGKQADLVILDRDPTAVPRAELKDIKVLETVNDGRTIFSAP